MRYTSQRQPGILPRFRLSTEVHADFSLKLSLSPELTCKDPPKAEGSAVGIGAPQGMSYWAGVGGIKHCDQAFMSTESYS